MNFKEAPVCTGFCNIAFPVANGSLIASQLLRNCIATAKKGYSHPRVEGCDWLEQ